MTMHLLPVFYTTTSTRKRKPSNNKRVAKSAAEHEAWVKSMTGGKKADKKVLDFKWKSKYTNDIKVDRNDYVSAGFGDGSTAKPTEKVYSGERKLLGIATMHKSNMVPVFAKSDAEDIARMRRG
jgi:acyl-coenzyme A synthetase/AMP-(fatty) acid ligase